MCWFLTKRSGKFKDAPGIAFYDQAHETARNQGQRNCLENSQEQCDLYTSRKHSVLHAVR